MGIASRIINELNRKSMSVSALEKELGFGNATIRRWDESSPSIVKVAMVANFLNVSMEYLITGNRAAPAIIDNDQRYLEFESTSQKIDYSNGILHLKDDTVFTRFKEAREAAGASIEEAAKGAFLKESQMLMLEGEDAFNEGMDKRLDRLQEIGLEQYAYLAFKYNVDLFWLFCGKVRPPAAVVQDRQLVFPPYEFMMEGTERAATAMHRPAPNYAHLELSEEEKELLQAYGCLTDEGKGWIYDLILDYLKRRQKISYSPHTENEESRGGTA